MEPFYCFFTLTSAYAFSFTSFSNTVYLLSTPYASNSAHIILWLKLSNVSTYKYRDCRDRSPKRKIPAYVACAQVKNPGECYYNTLLCWNYFSLLSVVSCTFSVLCVYSKFGHHPQPLLNHFYLCAKFGFFRSLHCWASPRRKIAYLINQSPSLFEVPESETYTSEKQI